MCPPIKKQTRKVRSAHAQALFDAKAKGYFIPDVEFVWLDRADIADGCTLDTALLFAYDFH